MPDNRPLHNLENPERVTYFAETDARGKRVPFGIKAKDRTRHMYVIGKTGMGKSTLLENLAIQDIQNGEGLTFIDPHGSTAEKLLEYVPKERAKDVLYFAPFDLQYPVSFNVMESVDADKRHLVVNGLMATFEKIWADAWSARMAYILQNTLLALLEYPGATLLGVNRMYTDKAFRTDVISHLTDPTARSFWVDEYSKYTDRYTQEATPAIQNKIGQFASNPLIRNIIGQSHSAFNLRELMDKRKILIINLSKGRVGEGNANLLGSMFITKLYLAAMSRAELSPQELSRLPDHYLYVDEFQNFANRSFADILSEARKYKLALTVAHQYIEQMEEEVRAAVFGNVGTMISFRVGSYDAEVLEKEFAPVFTMQDLVNLGFSQIYLKLMIDGVSSQPFSARTLPPVREPEDSHRELIVAHSRRQYARPRADIEDAIREWHKPIDTSVAPREKMGEKMGERSAEKSATHSVKEKEAPSRRPREAKEEAPSARLQSARGRDSARSGEDMLGERVRSSDASSRVSQTKEITLSDMLQNMQAVSGALHKQEKKPEVRVQESVRSEISREIPKEIPGEVPREIRREIPREIHREIHRERESAGEHTQNRQNVHREQVRHEQVRPQTNARPTIPHAPRAREQEKPAQSRMQKSPPIQVKKDAKGMTEEDKVALRAALSGFSGQRQVQPHAMHESKPQERVETREQAPQPINEQATESAPPPRAKRPRMRPPEKTQPEIPEQELRDMLRVEDE